MLPQTVDLPDGFKGSYFYRGREREEGEGREGDKRERGLDTRKKFPALPLQITEEIVS